MSWSDRFEAIGGHVTPYDTLSKGIYRPKPPDHTFRAIMDDPLTVNHAMGYKDKPFSLSYDVLRKIPSRVAIIASIIQTRCQQVSAFHAPYRLTKSIGYEIKKRDNSKQITPGDKEMIESLEKFIFNCGADKPNPHGNDRYYRDDFETFLKKIIRDSLTYDQVAFEVVPNHRGEPYEFIAVDASTVRIAASVNKYLETEGTQINDMLGTGHMYQSLKLTDDQRERPAYVQVIEGRICNVFTKEELAFGIRNPRSDIFARGYGYSEIEQIINIVTATLYAEEHNRKYFTNGVGARGILNFKGDSMSPEQLENFQRQWRANLEGTSNAWRTPVVQTEGGLEFIDLQKSNADMEFSQWLDYLIKICTSVFLIDPAELNFDFGGGGTAQTPLFESSQEWKLKASRDRGLKPLLKFVAKLINQNIVSKIDDNFMFDFVGLDELTEQEKHQLATEQLASYKTLNEIRRSMDLDDVEGGDIPLNPTFIQAQATMMSIKQQEQTMRQQEEQQQQQQEQQAGGAMGGAPAQGQGPGGAPPEELPGGNTPQYTDRFVKGLDEDELQIQLPEVEYDDSWIDIVRSSS